jgi:hypothetical protein
MGGGRAPQDNSAQVAAIEAQAARESREDAARKEAAARQAFEGRMSGAFGTGVQSAKDYFTGRGLNPDDYSSAINNRANLTRSSVPDMASDPGSYFADLGQQVFEQLQEGQRGSALRGINTVAPTGFANSRIADTADDSTLAAILGEQETAARGYIDNLLSRGVISQSGYNAALGNLTGQKAGANAKLNDVGNAILSGGRGEAENKANSARSRASNLTLGEQFDPYSVGNELNDFFTSFLGSLGEKVRGQAPSNLFDTSGLANVAGAAQGAGNRVFDPKALAGNTFGDNNDDEEENVNTNPF